MKSSNTLPNNTITATSANQLWGNSSFLGEDDSTVDASGVMAKDAIMEPERPLDMTLSLNDAVHKTFEPWQARLARASVAMETEFKAARFMIGPDGVPFFAQQWPEFDPLHVLTPGEAAHLYPFFYHGALVEKKFEGSEFKTLVGDIQRWPGDTMPIHIWGTSGGDFPMTLFMDINENPSIKRDHAKHKRSLGWNLPQNDAQAVAFYTSKELRDEAFVAILPGVVPPYKLKDRVANSVDITFSAKSFINPRYQTKPGRAPAVWGNVYVPTTGNSGFGETDVKVLTTDTNGKQVFVPGIPNYLVRYSIGIPKWELDKRYASNGKYSAGFWAVSYYFLGAQSSVENEDSSTEEFFGIPVDRKSTSGLPKIGQEWRPVPIGDATIPDLSMHPKYKHLIAARAQAPVPALQAAPRFQEIMDAPINMSGVLVPHRG